MSWPIKKLGEVGEFKAGYGFPNDFQGRVEGDFPFAKVGDISTVARRGEKYISTAGNYINAEELPLIKAKTIPKGTIVFAKIGEAISQNFRAITACEMLIDNNAMGLVPNSRLINLDYLYHFMCKLDLYRYTGATTVPALRKSTLEEIEIPLPHLTEQKRIAAILDKADTIRRKRQQAIQLADEFLRVVFLDMFGDPVANPKGWDVKPIAHGIESIASGWSANGESYPCKDGEYGVLKISAVTSGKFKPNENKLVATESIPEGKKLLFPKKGDLLFSRANTRELVAATCIVPFDQDNVFLPDKLWNIKTLQTEIIPEFLNYLIWQPRFKETLTSQATGTSGSMLNISKGKFEATDAIFPPLELQKKFKSLYWETQALIGKLEKSLANCEQAFSSFSQRAFSGRL